MAKQSRAPANKQHLERLNSAQAVASQMHAKADAARARADAASAKAHLVHADIRSKGKEIIYDAKGQLKVVDRQ